MGASLLAMAVYQAQMLSTDTPSSRAGALPQGLELFCRAGLAHNGVLFDTSHLASPANLDQQTGQH